MRYPEVAQTHFKDFETILADRKRINLLLWILQMSPSYHDTYLNKLKDDSQETLESICF